MIVPTATGRNTIPGGQRAVAALQMEAVWLVATFYNVLHGAADEITAGRLADSDAAKVITATLLAAFTQPGLPVPAAGQSSERVSSSGSTV